MSRLFWEKCFINNSEQVLTVVLYWFKYRSCPFVFFYCLGWFLAFSSFPSGVICNRTKWGIILLEHLVEERWERDYKRKGRAWGTKGGGLAESTLLLTAKLLCLVWSLCNIESNGTVRLLENFVWGWGLSSSPHSVLLLPVAWVHRQAAAMMGCNKSCAEIMAGVANYSRLSHKSLD